MTFNELKIRVGKNIKYYSNAGGWLTGRDVTETDIEDYINEVYTEEMFPLFVSRWPHLFRHTSWFNSWIMSATVATATNQTLTIVTDSNTAFANAFEGLWAYNETQDEYARLKTYVDTDEMTVYDDYDLDADGWTAGDTIYILGQEFAFGGDSNDIFSIERVRVKYSATEDTQYSIAELRDKQDLFVTGQEEFSRNRPFVYLTSVQDSGAMYQAIGIAPQFSRDEKITKAIEFDYIAKPAAITGAATTPIIPIQESIICGATMKAYEKKQDEKMAAYWQTKYELAKKRDISRYKPNTTNVPADIKVNRNAYYIHRRII